MARAAGLTCALLLLAACAGTEPPAPPPAPLPPLVLEPRLELRLEPGPGPQPARSLRVTVRLGTPDGVPLRVVPCGAEGAAGLLDLTVSWEDFRGQGPVSSGRSTQVLVPWPGESEARPGAPCVRTADVALEPADGILARRCSVEGRLIGIDLVREEGHTGGRMFSLPRATLDSFAPAPPGLLEEHLQSGQPDGIFLAAAGAPPAWREHVLGALVEALPSSRGPAREAIFAALFWLTGETRGRDVHRWSAWWNERRHREP